LAAVAAGVAWWLARRLYGHEQPTFAGIAAIVCLAPGLPNRGAQAVNMMLGLMVGILVGEALLALPVGYPALRISIMSFLAMIAAVSFGLAPVIAIQAGVSAILVIAMGPMTAGPVRLMDAAVGAVVALMFSQVLFTPDPRQRLAEAAGRVFRLMSLGFRLDAEALASADQSKGQAALRHFLSARDSLGGFRAEIEAARTSMRWTLRGRLGSADIIEQAAQFERYATHLLASALLFADGSARLLVKRIDPQLGVQARLTAISTACERLADDLATSAAFHVGRDPDEQKSARWQTCLDHLREIEDVLQTLGAGRGATL
jgi:uncharacterized membrane protein YgaE (UPF0421/DUF939 family)